MDLAARTPAERFAGILAWLKRDIAAGAMKNKLAIPLILLLWPRLNRLAARFAALAARVAAGTAAPRRRMTPRPANARPRKPYARLPRRFAWLVRLVPESAAYGSQLQYLLSDPEMTALIAAAPQAGRLLRPLCRMLGVRPPPALAPTPRRRRPRAAPAARPAAGPFPPAPPAGGPPRSGTGGTTSSATSRRRGGRSKNERPPDAASASTAVRPPGYPRSRGPARLGTCCGGLTWRRRQERPARARMTNRPRRRTAS